MPRILSVSYDPVLLHTRELILRDAGYEVVSVLGLSQAIDRCAEHFDLIIMGHSIPQPEKRSIVAELRNRGCAAPILSLLRSGDSPIPEAAAAVDPEPRAVLAAVKKLLTTLTIDAE